jgi:hypothetical protein
MIYIYGDSHADHSFRNLKLTNTNNYHTNITMFRIGRDNIIINFDNKEHDKDSIIVLCYGEIDCRCHIQRQINIGNKEDEIIFELVNNYFVTITNNVKLCKKIIIVGVIPPTNQREYENLNGPITQEFPFVGTDEDRVRYTLKLNNLLQKKCIENDYIYFNPYDYYTRKDGTLKYEFSDKTVHLNDNLFFLEKFMELCKTI